MPRTTTAISDLELVYSVNGGAEKVLKLFKRRASGCPKCRAGHTFYLEELGVQVGDSVSYYARATDNDAVRRRQAASSDLYFLRIRPFKKDFRQAQSQGGGGGGGGGGGNQVRRSPSSSVRSSRPRSTCSAIARASAPTSCRENSTVVALSQSRLREQVEGMLTRMNSQLVERDPAFAEDRRAAAAGR